MSMCLKINETVRQAEVVIILHHCLCPLMEYTWLNNMDVSD